MSSIYKMINGISNSFAATIDGLTNFELTSLTVDELDAETINVETEIFTPIVVLKDGANTTTISQSGLQTIIQNDENLGTMTFNCKGPFGANVQSLTLSYLTTTVNTSVLQVNGRVQPNTIRFPDGVTVGDKVVYLRGEDYDAFGNFIGYNIYKDYKVTFRNSPDNTGDLFYNIPVGYAHTFSYGDTSYVNILSIRSNGDIVYPDNFGTKITYYTGYSTEIATDILRHIVPAAASHRFKVGTTDVMTIDSTGVNILVSTGNIALKDAANTFTQSNIFKTITFTNTTSERQITLFRQVDANAFTHYGFNVEVIAFVGTLRYHAPNGTQHLFSISNAGNTAYTNILSISNTEINVNASNSTSGSPRLVFWKHPTNSGRDSYIVRSGVNLIYSTGETGAASYHVFQIGIPGATNVFFLGDNGASLERGNFNMTVGDIRFPATATTKIQYYGAGGGYSTEVAAGILRQVSPSQHIWKVGSVDTLTLSATALTCEEVIYAKNAMRTDDALFLYDQTILSPVNRSRLYHYNTNLYIDNITIGGFTFIQARNALGNAVDIFEVNIDECNITAPNGLNIIGNGGLNMTNSLGFDAIIRMEELGSYPYLYIKNLEPSGWITFECRNASNANTLVMDIGYQEVWLYGVLRVCQDWLNYGLHTLFTQTNAVFDMQNDVNSGSINFKVKDASANIITPLALTSTNATLGANVSLQQSGTGIINQVGTGTNELKDTDVNGTLNVTGSIELSGTANINQSGTAIINQTGTGTNELKNTDVTGNLTVTGSIDLLSATGTKITYNPDYVVSTASNVLRTNVPTAATQHFSVNNVDVVSVSASTTTIRNNITLSSSPPAPSNTQLGGKQTSSIIITLPQTFTSGSTEMVLGSCVISAGTYIINVQFAFQCTATGALTKEEYSINTSGNPNITTNCIEIIPHSSFSPATSAIICRRLSHIYNHTGGSNTIIYPVVRLTFTSGTFVVNTTSQNTYVKFDVHRIA